MTFTEQDLKKAFDKAKIDLMSRPDSAFFTTICFSLIHIWDEAVPTACTNGIEIRMNPKFFMDLTKDEQVGLLLHETLHVAYLHMIRLADRHPQKWNIAVDHVINLQLQERGFSLPKGALMDPQYQGMSGEQVYPLIPDSPSNDNFDMDLGEPTGSIEGLEEQVKEILVRASVQSKVQGDKPGTIPGEIEIFLEKLLNPKLPWQRILQKYLHAFSKGDYTFKKPNRRFFPKHLMPSLHSESLMDIAIAVDTSGSVTDAEFTQFLSETHSILKRMKPEKITFIQFDTELKAINEVKSIQDLYTLKFTGRGGTEIYPVIAWANTNKPKLLLVFSDGYFYFHQTDYKLPLIWLVHQNPNFTAPYGKVIHYEVT